MSADEDFPSPEEIKALAEDYGYIERRPSASYTLFFKEKTQQKHPTLINVFYTTRGIMTKLSHPTQGYNSLWRADAYDSLEMLAELFENPRTHTGKGYRQAKLAVRGCCMCGEQKKKGKFSLNQWRLGPGKAVCLECMDKDVVGKTAEDSNTSYDKRKEEKPITNLHEVMKHNSKVNITMERRQFNCPLCPQEGRGKTVFFKRVPADRPIVKCNKCKKVNKGECERLYPIPKGEEKGYGFFRCHECSTTWGSSRSIANIGQQCHACQISGKSNVYVKPFRIEAPRPGKSRGIAGGGARAAGRRMRRVPRESIAENEVENAEYSEVDGARFHNNNNGFGGGRGGTTGVGRSFDFVPNEDDRSASASASGSTSSSSMPSLQQPRCVHKCEGCATGLCRSRKLPISGIHDSTGDTLSTSGSVTTNSRIDDREFRDMDEDFDDWDEDDGSVYVTMGFNGKVLRG